MPASRFMFRLCSTVPGHQVVNLRLNHAHQRHRQGRQDDQDQIPVGNAVFI